YDHLVDDDLREKRRGKGDELDEERCEKNVAPDLLVPQQLVPEPAEAEARGFGGAVASRLLRALVPEQNDLWREALAGLGGRERGGRARACFEVQNALGVRPGQDRGPWRIRVEKANAGVRSAAQPRFARAKAERLRRFDELSYGVRGGKALQEQRRVKRNAVELAQASREPDKMIACERRAMARAQYFLSGQIPPGAHHIGERVRPHPPAVLLP